jgi:hypothetical protein
MLGRISGRELLVRMSVWLLFLVVYVVGFVLYDCSLLSANGLTRMFEITACTTIPIFLLHQWILNQKKKVGNDPQSGSDTG